MSQWCDHIRAVVLHNLHRVQRDAILCPCLAYFANLYLFLFPHLRGSSVLIPLLYSSIPSVSASAADNSVSTSPSSSITACSQHRIPTHSPPLPLRRLAQVQNWSRRNILHDRILPPLNVGFHRLKTHLLSRRLRQVILPPSIQPLMWYPPRQFPCHLVLETPQDPSHAGGNHPRLCTK